MYTFTNPKISLPQGYSDYGGSTVLVLLLLIIIIIIIIITIIIIIIVNWGITEFMELHPS